MNKNFKLAVILVNWNRSDDTLNCLESIHYSTYTDFIIIVVDNGSSVEEINKLKQFKLNFVLIEAGENLGYTGGNNIGIHHSHKFNVEYIMLLNNDTFIASDALENIIKSADSDQKVGILSPKILFHPARNIIWSAGTVFNDRFLIGYLSGYKKVDKGQFNQERDVDYVTGCAMMIRTKVIHEVGVLCDDYFAVCEDIDYCLRVRNAGYKIKYQPTAIIWHIESASSGGTDAPQYVYYQTRNYFLFHNRWSKNVIQLICSQCYYLIYVTKRGLNFLIKGQWKSILGILYGIRDVVLGRLGRRDYKNLVISKND